MGLENIRAEKPVNVVPEAVQAAPQAPGVLMLSCLVSDGSGARLGQYIAPTRSTSAAKACGGKQDQGSGKVTVGCAMLINPASIRPKAHPEHARQARRESVWVAIFFTHSSPAPLQITQQLQEPFSDSAITSPDMIEEYHPTRLGRVLCTLFIIKGLTSMKWRCLRSRTGRNS